MPVDTGFLVYNENTYPNLIGMFEVRITRLNQSRPLKLRSPHAAFFPELRLRPPSSPHLPDSTAPSSHHLQELGVPTEPSDMSFSVSLAGRSFEWGSDGLRGLFATPSNALSPSFHSMVSDMMRFNKEGPAWLKAVTEDAAHPQSGWTMRQYLDAGKYLNPFTHWYLLPQVAAVWSASSADVLAFPATTFIRFCVNHSLLQAVDRPQWRTVSRRSREYVRRLAAALSPDTTTIKLSTPVTRVTRKAVAGSRTGTIVSVTDASGSTSEFDAVVFGCHPDEALTLMGDASAEERSTLGAFVYQGNTAYLHTDASLMPARRAAWASWNYIGKGEGTTLALDDAEPCCVSYWLNRLQNLPSGTPEMFVTLNPAPGQVPPAGKILQTFSYSHPQYTLASVSAQGRLAGLQGKASTWWAGAYLGYGFHEDGVTSGLRVAHGLTSGAAVPGWWNLPFYTVPAPLAPHADASSPAALLADIRAKKACGGPYWRDNLGNGGPIGDATEAVKAAVAAARAVRAAQGVPGSTAALRGTAGEVDDIEGFLVAGPDDVMLTYRTMLGLADVDAALAAGPAAASGSSSSSSGRGTPEPSPMNLPTARNSESGGSGNNSDDSHSEDGAVSDSGSLTVRPASGRGKAGASAVGSGLISPGRAAKRPALTVDTAASRKAAAAAAATKGSSAAGTTDVVQLLLGGKRAYKGEAVGTAVLAAMQRAAVGTSILNVPGSKPAPVVTTQPLGARMIAGQGGYTAQEAPLQTPAAHGSPLSWIWDSALTAARYAAASPVLSFLRKSVVAGAIMLRFPDGSEQIFGDPSACYPHRARIRVHSWNFFLRVAAETDLGLSRSFIAGDWTCDDLASLFHVFILNRDTARTLSAYGLWTAWLGATLNYVSFAWNMDNSLAGSRRNISAHYDISNDLYTSFLDARTMMYSCGFFDVSRRYVAEVDLPAEGAAPGSARRRLTREAAVAGSVSTFDVPAQSPSADVIASKASAAAAAGGKRKREADAAPASSSSSSSSSAPSGPVKLELVFGGSLADAQTRKLDHLIARANVQPTDRVLDLGFGWGGLSIRLAESVGCRVHGITLSKEQLALATERVAARGLSHLVTFELVDYRDFAAAHKGEQYVALRPTP